MLGYCIQYNPENNKKYPVRKNMSKGFWRWTVVIVTIALTVSLIKQDTVKTIKEFLLPGDPECTEQAIITFVENLRTGESFSNAAAAFCLEIIENAQESA